jgi:hypothetical protein
LPIWVTFEPEPDSFLLELAAFPEKFWGFGGRFPITILLQR